MSRTQWVFAIAAGLFVCYLVFGRSDFYAFDTQREAWHRRCDAYINAPARGANKIIVDECQRELQELLAYAKRKGWAN
jgi:hypothetical protein